MRKKINNRIYDTDTAEFICDSNTWQGKLYRKYQSNQFFFLSRNGLNITPATWKEAKETAKRNAPSYLYFRHFTSRTDQEGRTTIDISRSDYNKLKAIAGIREQTNKQTLHEIIGNVYRKLDRHMTEQ